MKLARWTAANEQFEGFIHEGRAVGFPQGVTISELLRKGLEATRSVFDAVLSQSDTPTFDLQDVALQVPLQAASVRDFVTFEEHVEGVSGSVDGKNEVVPQWYETPTFYFTNPHTLRPTGVAIDVLETQKLDFELEVAAIVGGEPASNLTAEEATQRIFGYCIFNDWSARDLQSREMKVKLGPCKGKDFATTLGPWIVTADELHSHIDSEGFLRLRAEAYINGELIGEDLISNMGWPFGELVAYASRNSLVVAGDVLGSGTIGNGGCLGELWGRGKDIPALEPGDEVTCRVTGLGEISNRVGQRIPAPHIPPARRRPRDREI